MREITSVQRGEDLSLVSTSSNPYGLFFLLGMNGMESKAAPDFLIKFNTVQRLPSSGASWAQLILSSSQMFYIDICCLAWWPIP